jgi:hypothetical protein
MISKIIQEYLVSVIDQGSKQMASLVSGGMSTRKW